ncbi:chemotaxis-specific protein-glutamate methyltransferase CheB [Natronorubrum sp. JWXQ-INN-674]|uniref:Protein-glutamate methylesterase/protein-glutamine glutaminase n=1 Tax=Natronorubrum halalkaliphilum TaxID=2691917 RepID=A0A6B0VRN6_9EURY|nr:chemotaxis-specific protein-glutamate methyltransferase CheB [Natronorubrum halalkaliphilum]MXV64005.1 chemotaxis-specific protein-glutamate methyltransferase CheB [Natronorubrum halalkaliphilum]
MTRVLVVDDSQFMRTVIGNALTAADYDVETATNGSEAIEAATAYDPDIVTMDVEMPELDGIDAVERIMATNPTLILMLSVHTDRGTEATLDALERGAIDFLNKPDGSDSRNVADLCDDVVEKVDELANANVSSIALARAAASAYATRPDRSDGNVTAGRAAVGSGTGDGNGTRVRTGTGTGSGPKVRSEFESATETGVEGTPNSPGPERPAPTPSSTLKRRSGGGRANGTDERDDRAAIELEGEYAADPTIVLGASTGGPKIVEQVFDRLPLEFDAKGLVVQHMPSSFTGRFAERLDRRSRYDVSEAADGDTVRSGEILVAPGGAHLEVTGNVGGHLTVGLDDGDRIHGVRPAIDVTMRTAAERVSDPLCGVVLTGMGRDGAAGIEAIKTAGGHTVAQDEATSPVFGIPCQAIQTGCVDDITPAGELADTIVDAFNTDGENDD